MCTVVGYACVFMVSVISHQLAVVAIPFIDIYHMSLKVVRLL